MNLYAAPRSQTSLQQFFGRYHELIDRNERSIYQMAIDLSLLSFFPLPPTRPLHNLSF